MWRVGLSRGSPQSCMGFAHGLVCSAVYDHEEELYMEDTSMAFWNTSCVERLIYRYCMIGM